MAEHHRVQDLNWAALRPLRGSQREAFEELCCQLAATEVPDPIRFRRVGAPDGGVEAYYVENDATESGWQAKFFLRAPDGGQWQQIDRSVRRALETHPQLARYTIVLPIDRADPRRPDAASFMDQWDAHAAKWRGWAAAEGRDLDLRFWGSHELLERLARPEHEGRARFWFDQEVFGPLWLRRRLDEALENTRPRYPAPVHIDVPVRDDLDGLLRHERWRARCGELLRNVFDAHASAKAMPSPVAIEHQVVLDQNLDALLNLGLDGARPASEKAPLEAAEDLATQAWRSLDEILATIDVHRSDAKAAAATRAGRRGRRRKKGSTPSPYLDGDYARFAALRRGIEDLAYWLDSRDAYLTNATALIVRGDPGSGKSELLRDAVRQGVEEGRIVVLLAGKQFNGDDPPWGQIAERLGASFASPEEFLGALSAAAESSGRRALVAIDALNEGGGPALWRPYLAGMLATLRSYPWIALAVSLRSSYEDVVLPVGIDRGTAVRVTHHGFMGQEYAATQAFFTHFGIRPPATPLLVPEFSNPLFLMLFCQGLQRRGLTEAPTGLEGIDAVFSFFLESADLAVSDRLKMSRARRLVRQAVTRIAAAMVAAGEQRLRAVDAQRLVNAELPNNPDRENLYQAMIDEGILDEDVLRTPDGERDFFVGFTYNRLADHEVMRYVLANSLETSDLPRSFDPGSPLGLLVSDSSSGAWRRSGEVEALFIQLPELTDMDLFDAVPRLMDVDPVRHAFLRSLVWRRPSTITTRTTELALACARHSPEDFGLYQSSLLILAPRAGHPLSADHLHGRLVALELPRRDAGWTAWVTSEYQGGGHLTRRLLDWAEAPQQHRSADDTTVHLVATALAWFLASSDRHLRDRTTKALVVLLGDRIGVLVDLIERFTGVNDPYVVERVYAVACGVALRTASPEALQTLALAVYRFAFQPAIPPSILLRDYARQVIEVAVTAGIALDIDLTRFRPPYGSTWPAMTMRPLEEIAPEIPLDEIRARASEYHVRSSVLQSGDFARYVIGTNFGRFDWINVPLDSPLPATREQLVQRFRRSLSAGQRQALKRYERAADLERLTESAGAIRRNAAQQVLTRLGTTRTAIRKELQGARTHLRETLGASKWQRFHVEFQERLHGGREPWEFDLTLLQRWIYQRVLELGWSADLHGAIDSMGDAGYSRHEHRRERISKKYQWIAYHECLARIADNFRFRGPSWSLSDARYEGPYQIAHGRDLDPSLLLSQVPQVSVYADTTATWWTPLPSPDWTADDDISWIRNAVVPPMRAQIAVADRDGLEWLCADIDHQWTYPATRRVRLARSGIQRNLVLQVTGFAVEQQHVDAFDAWARDAHLSRIALPRHGSPFTHVFLGEYPWAQSYRTRRSESPPDGWFKIEGAPAPVRPLTELYGAGGEYDGSVDAEFSIVVPAPWLVEAMGLSWRAQDGRWFDAHGNLVAFDPSLREAGVRTLLLRSDRVLEALRRQDLALVWFLQGTKRILAEPGTIEYPGELEIIGIASSGPPWHARVRATYLTLEEIRARENPSEEPMGEVRLERDEE